MNEQKICIKQYEQAADEKVSLGGIRWERKWDVCVQCDSREEAERVRAALTMKHEPTTGNVLMDAYHAMQAKKEAAQPEQSPLDRMAENARELGLDYEPVQEPEYEQALMDAITGGTGVVLGGKRIDPASIYKEPEQEPVAWMQEMPTKGDETRSVRLTTVEALAREEWPNPIPLYTTPPRREWVGLTSDEIAALWDVRHDIQGFARAIEAKLKEKNGRVDSFLRRLLDPEDLGHAVSHEVRQKVRELL